MASDRLRVAIAGAGMVTQHHLISWSRVPGAEVVAISNRDQRKAEARAADFGIPKAYGDAVTMMDAERPDVLDIAVAVDVHADLVRAAAARGIAVLCQKPLCPTFEEASALVEEIGDRVPFMVHENWRFRPQYRQAREWVQAGRIGAVRQFRLAACSSGLIADAGEERPFALARQPFMATMPRFIIFELLIHHLDTMRCLVGGRLRVAGALVRRVSPLVIGEDVASILLESDNGAMGTVAGNFSAGGYPARTSDSMELIGEAGRIVFEGSVLRLHDSRGNVREEVGFNLDAAYQGSYDGAIAHFARCLADGQVFETDRIDNLETLRLVDQAYAMAAEQGRRDPA